MVPVADGDVIKFHVRHIVLLKKGMPSLSTEWHAPFQMILLVKDVVELVQIALQIGAEVVVINSHVD